VGANKNLMDTTERDGLVAQIDNLTIQLANLTKANEALEAANTQLVRVLQQVDWMLIDIRNLTKNY
jgi:hypothetical protein